MNLLYRDKIRGNLTTTNIILPLDTDKNLLKTLKKRNVVLGEFQNTNIRNFTNIGDKY